MHFKAIFGPVAELELFKGTKGTLGSSGLKGHAEPSVLKYYGLTSVDCTLFS